MAGERQEPEYRRAEQGEAPKVRREPARGFVFREEPPPRFNLPGAGLIALLLLLLLGLSSEQARLFELSAEELRQLELEKQELEREMMFRFVEAPADEAPEERETRFLSDADRLMKSQQQEELPPDNTDPISQGNTFELENARPTEPSMTQPSVPTPPAPRPTPEPSGAPPQETEAEEALADEPTEVEEPSEVDKPEPAEADAPEQGSVPFPEAGGPKPYRRMTEEEKALARERASAELRNLNLNESPPPSPSTKRYDNPAGATSPLAGFSIETTRSDLGEYLKILRQLVKSNWRIPNIARYEVSGVSVVSFRLHKDGRITDARLVTSSAYDPLDTSSLNAIINTYKAPPLPPHVQEDWIPMKFGFYYNMRPRY